MCQSLGKKDFSKKGLAAMCVYDALYCAELAKRQANGLEGVESLTPLVEKAKSIAKASEMLLLKRSELEALAEQVKGKYSSWGSYACFSSSQF